VPLAKPGVTEDVLDRTLELDPPPVVIAMTARAELHGAVAAIRRGATDYLAMTSLGPRRPDSTRLPGRWSIRRAPKTLRTSSTP
jgi:hypothetical protein